MHFSTAVISAVLSATALAAPALESRADPNWTITSMKRVCNAADTSCTWTFGIDTHLSAATPCSFTVTGSPASQTSNTGSTCGAYTVSSGWSGQFGPGNGFTTLAVVDNTRRKIAFPAYTDKQLAGGAVVTPDQSYPASSL
ncbi:hypothetical protein JX265_000749 [Neoarthrinium moseri]|uniref:Small secreted protein n=1 Tax=Neoarthrinium moseri TaxID=1658444 RepID=A0A9Q0AVT3_9PEZI|nr:uncharacterized protein JN550_007144 [Neoarthrinium moseri]KAI1847499.1 hypothetical protein JX266_006351 [Neoarthrinium moseri]KAI1867413.1 hypothetical protein JN550_007144 [Neoarthrinium moseri]KAI1880509.1 hypothetical protein JX265_000749 [Neoarthrinium moseri]